MKDKIAIFGAGQWGKTAYHYYKDKANVSCFLDNRESLWGSTVDGLEVLSPEEFSKLDLQEIVIVIAVSSGLEEIQKQIFEKYGITESIQFRIEQQGYDYQIHDNCQDEIIVSYEGGLGNQMFQYAFAKCFMEQGKNVTADTTGYILLGQRDFNLPEVFPSINITKSGSLQKQQYISSRELK